MKAFADTNVIVYALASDDPRRQGIARRLLAEHGNRLVLSTQVLMETYHVLVRKKGVAPEVALDAVRLFDRHPVAAPGCASVLAALALAGSERLSSWDALIVQAALDAGCDTLFSEDLQAGRRFGPLVVVNPFAPAAHEGAPA